MERTHFARRSQAPKKALGLTALIISLVSLSIGVSSASSASKPVRIAFFSESIANTYTHATQLAIQAVAKEQGATVQIFDANFDPHKQFTQMQDALASKKFDAFLAVPLDSVGLIPLVAQAGKAGIKFGAISFPLGANLATSKPQAPGQWVAVLDPAVSRGKWIGGMIVQACGSRNPCKVAYIGGAPSIPSGKGEIDGIKATIKGHSNIRIVATQPGGYLSAPALKAMQNILQAHSDVNVVASDGDQMIQGAALALKAANIKYGTGPNDVKLIGLGASIPALKGIRSGAWFGTALSLPYDEGRIAAKLIIKAARGQLKKPTGLSAALASGRNPMVTKATVGNLKAQWTG